MANTDNAAVELLELYHARTHAHVLAWQIRQGGRRIAEAGQMAAGARAQLLEVALWGPQ